MNNNQVTKSSVAPLKFITKWQLGLAVCVLVCLLSCKQSVFAQNLDKPNQSLAITSATAGEAGQPMTGDELERHGKQLRVDIENANKEMAHTKQSAYKEDVSSIVAKYIPVGTSFKDAEAILKSAGADLAPSPPRAPRPDDPSYNLYNILGGFIINKWAFGNAEFAVNLDPDRPGDSNAKVKSVSATIFINNL